jgi:type I restriction enzyme S subunit
VKLKKLDDVCDFISGLWTGKNPPFVNVSVIRNTNFHKSGNLNFENIAELDVEVKQFKTRQLKYGDIILEKSGGGPKQPVGRVCVFEKDDGLYSLSNFTSAIRIKNNKELDYKYLHYFLLNLYVTGKTEKIQTNSTGIRNLQLSLYKDFLVPVLSLAIQQKIVAKLDAIFAEIDVATAATEANAKNAEALFQSYLTEVFENAEAEWKIHKLKDITTKITDGSHNPPKGLDFSNYLMFSSKNINNDSITFDSPRFLSKEDYELENKRTQVTLGDVLLTIVGTIGRCAVVEDAELKITLQRSVSVIKPKAIINSRFLMYFFQSINKLLNERARGVAQKGIYLETLRELDINFPDIKNQILIVSRLDKISEQIEIMRETYVDKISQLSLYKQSILQRAFSGELVKD